MLCPPAGPPAQPLVPMTSVTAINRSAAPAMIVMAVHRCRTTRSACASSRVCNHESPHMCELLGMSANVPTDSPGARMKVLASMFIVTVSTDRLKFGNSLLTSLAGA